MLVALPSDSCYQCGGDLDDGYEVRDGPTERDTGYSEVRFYCGVCLEENDAFAAADTAYEMEGEY